MKKLVFLHGSGSDKDAYGDLLKIVAHHFDAELLSFNAPFEHAEKAMKYKWFNKVENNGRRDAVENEYIHSLQYIKKMLLSIDTDAQNIILLGHSQGGGMAVHIGLEMPLKCAISINGDLPYNMSYENISNTPIYWFESEKDTYINQERKNSYSLIKNINNLHYKKLPNSTHNDFSDDFIKVLQSGYIKI